uniref:Uncharacterized protein n=1 Tax=Strigamia maritima TaxID=126957 RepID=T1IW57_STRMM
MAKVQCGETRASPLQNASELAWRRRVAEEGGRAFKNSWMGNLVRFSGCLDFPSGILETGDDQSRDSPPSSSHDPPPDGNEPKCIGNLGCYRTRVSPPSRWARCSVWSVVTKNSCVDSQQDPPKQQMCAKKGNISESELERHQLKKRKENATRICHQLIAGFSEEWARKACRKQARSRRERSNVEDPCQQANEYKKKVMTNSLP